MKVSSIFGSTEYGFNLGPVYLSARKTKDMKYIEYGIINKAVRMEMASLNVILFEDILDKSTPPDLLSEIGLLNAKLTTLQKQQKILQNRDISTCPTCKHLQNITTFLNQKLHLLTTETEKILEGVKNEVQVILERQLKKKSTDDSQALAIRRTNQLIIQSFNHKLQRVEKAYENSKKVYEQKLMTQQETINQLRQVIEKQTVFADINQNIYKSVRERDHTSKYSTQNKENQTKRRHKIFDRSKPKIEEVVSPIKKSNDSDIGSHFWMLDKLEDLQQQGDDSEEDVFFYPQGNEEHKSPKFYSPLFTK